MFVSIKATSCSKAKHAIAPAGVGADAGERQQRRDIARELPAVLIEHRARRALHIHRAAIVAQPCPGADDIGGRCRRQRLERRELIEERQVLRHDPIHLSLLEHDLGHQDAIGVAGAPPGQIARGVGEPGQQRPAYIGEIGRLVVLAITTSYCHSVYVNRRALDTPEDCFSEQIPIIIQLS